MGAKVCQVPPKLLDALVKLSTPEKMLLSLRRVDDAEELPMQVPLSAKQPPARLMPSANVEVAVVEVALKFNAATAPSTSSLDSGFVVPMPTLPLVK